MTAAQGVIKKDIYLVNIDYASLCQRKCERFDSKLLKYYVSKPKSDHLKPKLLTKSYMKLKDLLHSINVFSV